MKTISISIENAKLDFETARNISWARAKGFNTRDFPDGLV